MLLREFFVKRSLHNRVQLRKELHEFEMRAGDDLMVHLMRFDELCMRLAAVGDALQEDEKLVILLGSLSSNYNQMMRILEDRENVSLYEAKEMLRREFESFQKKNWQEGAFKVRFGGHRDQCFECGRRGHKRDQCKFGKETKRPTSTCSQCRQMLMMARCGSSTAA